MKRFLLTLAFAGLLISASAEEKKPTVYMVSNAHFDTQWNWDVQRSISEYLLRTVERNLFLYRTGIKGFRDICQLKHGCAPFWLICGRFCSSSVEQPGTERQSMLRSASNNWS